VIAPLKTWIVELQAAYLPPGSIRKRFAAGTFWSLTGTLVSQGLQLLAAIVAARFLGKTGYGELGIIQSTAAMFGAFASLALGLTATKNIAEFRKQDPDRAGRVLGLTVVAGVLSGAIIGLALVAFARPFSARVLSAPGLTGVLRLSALLVLLTTVNGVQIAALTGFEKFADVAKVSAVRGITSFPAIVIGTWLWGLWGAVGGMVTMAAATWVASEILMHRACATAGVKVHYIENHSEWPLLWTFSFPVVLSMVIVYPVMWLGNALLVNRPGGYAEMGVFNAAWQLSNVIIFLPRILNQVLFPILSNLYSSRSQARKLFLASLGVVSVISLVVALPLILFSPSFMRAFGTGFEGSWRILVFLALSSIFMALASVVDVVIWSSGRMWVSFFLKLVWGGLFISAALILLEYGAEGLSLAYLGSYVALLLLSLAYVFSRTHLGEGRKGIPSYLLGGGGPA
jgi:O-antigen/teichoic acid export membrane protein